MLRCTLTEGTFLPIEILGCVGLAVFSSEGTKRRDVLDEILLQRADLKHPTPLQLVIGSSFAHIFGDSSRVSQSMKLKRQIRLEPNKHRLDCMHILLLLFANTMLMLA
jgi:hypothetical protein